MPTLVERSKVVFWWKKATRRALRHMSFSKEMKPNWCRLPLSLNKPNVRNTTNSTPRLFGLLTDRVIVWAFLSARPRLFTPRPHSYLVPSKNAVFLQFCGVCFHWKRLSLSFGLITRHGSRLKRETLTLDLIHKVKISVKWNREADQSKYENKT